MTALISATALKDLLESGKDLIIIDARPNFDAYQQEHITGAHHLDINLDLSAKTENAANGGRHPLPTPAAFSEVLSSLGIQDDSQIIIYDQNNSSMAAARAWWMLRGAGLSKVQVLNGGLDAAKKVGDLTEAGVNYKNKSSHYTFKAWKLPIASIEEVDEASKNLSKLIIDVRTPERYEGISEPIDLIAGHIPNAINLPFTNHLKADGTFITKSELRGKYKSFLKDKASKDVIIHCGSGVTACHTLLALDYAGFELPKLYVGSWSEWSRNDKPIAKGKD
ncbi:MAG: sulfurtransferase [Weeksellaceae bacterium]